MKAELIRENGMIGVCINGKRFPFAATRSFRPEGRIIRQFSDYGIKFFNVFPSGIMTALHKRTVPYSGFGPVWVGDHEYNWDNLRAQCDEFFPNLASDTYVSLSVHLDPPPWYVESHPGMVDHWEQMIQNLGSEEWKRDAADYMRALIDKMDEWYPERVFAIHLMSGGTTEWYSYHADKVVDAPTEMQRELYRKYSGREMPSLAEVRAGSDGVLRHPVADKNAIDYMRFTNDTIADTVCYFARVAKEHTKNTKLVGLFNMHSFGMQLDLAVRMGYNGARRLLSCPDIDMIFAPASYISRKLDSTSGIRTPVDSIRDSGKLFVHEIDSSTHLVKGRKPTSNDASATHGKGRDEEFTCTGDTVAYIRREAGIAIAKGIGYWWFDMFSGYYDDERLMKEIGDIRGVQEKLMNMDNRSVSKVCELIDIHSNYMLATGCHYPMAEQQTAILNNAGAPWDMRIADDLFEPWFDDLQYDLYIFPALFAPDERMKEKISELRRKGRSILFMHAPGYVTENGFSEAEMEKLTGIRLVRCELSDNAVEGIGSFEGIGYGFTTADAPGDVTVTELEPHKAVSVSPVFAAEGLDTVFGCFRENGKPACGVKFRPDGSFDAYSANAPVPGEIIAEIYRLAGIFTYADPGTVVYTNSGFECVYSYLGGEAVLRRPEDSVLCDAFTGERIAVGPSGATVEFSPRETRYFLVEKKV